jgi:hypothetical protein
MNKFLSILWLFPIIINFLNFIISGNFDKLLMAGMAGLISYLYYEKTLEEN